MLVKDRQLANELLKKIKQAALKRLSHGSVSDVVSTQFDPQGLRRRWHQAVVQ